MLQKIIITIDGWSSCGKSTLAKQLAKQLAYTYIDSGAMYRAITLYFLRNHIDWTDDMEVKNALNEVHLHFEPNEKSGESEIFLNDENVEYLKRYAFLERACMRTLAGWLPGIPEWEAKNEVG